MVRISGLGWWEHSWTDSQGAGDTGFYSGFVLFCPLVVVALESELRTRLGRCSCLSCNSCSTHRTDTADLGIESFPTLLSPMPAPPVPSCIFCLRPERPPSTQMNYMLSFASGVASSRTSRGFNRAHQYC